MNSEYAKSRKRQSRRTFFLRAAAAGAFFLRPAKAAENPPPPPEETRSSGTFRFVAVNDTHLKDEKCVVFFRKAVSVIRNLAARTPLDFVIISGDLATAGRNEEYELFKQGFSGLGIPLYVVPGNHDYNLTDRSAYDQAFPGRVNYTFDHKGWRFIGFDTTDGSKWLKVRARPETVQFLRKILDETPARVPIVGFTHFPLGAGVKMRLKNADEILGLFRRHTLVHVLSGHWHGFTRRTWRRSTLTTDRCLSLSRGNHDGTKEKGFFVCTARGKTLDFRFVEVEP